MLNWWYPKVMDKYLLSDPISGYDLWHVIIKDNTLTKHIYLSFHNYALYICSN